jgi:hypothetical protein
VLLNEHGLRDVRGAEDSQGGAGNHALRHSPTECEFVLVLGKRQADGADAPSRLHDHGKCEVAAFQRVARIVCRYPRPRHRHAGRGEKGRRLELVAARVDDDWSGDENRGADGGEIGPALREKRELVLHAGNQQIDAFTPAELAQFLGIGRIANIRDQKSRVGEVQCR